MKVSLFLVRGLYTYMRDERPEAGVFLRECGISREQLEQPYAQVDARLMVRAVKAAYQISADPALGLHLGASVPPQILPVLGNLFVQAPSIRGAIADAQRYLPLVAHGGSFSLAESQDRAVFSFRLSGTEGAELPFVVEFAFSWIVAIARQLVGKLTAPRELRVPFAAPDYAAEYERVFRCSVTFDAPIAQIVFDRSFLDARNPCFDARLYRVLKDEIETLMLERSASVPLHVRVRTIFENDAKALGEDGPRLLTRALGLSERSLRRRLVKEGMPLGALRETVRRELAYRLLGETDLPVKEIVERLGFSEPSPFYRAFRRWAGDVTPVDFRAARQGLLSQLAS